MDVGAWLQDLVEGVPSASPTKIDHPAFAQAQAREEGTSARRYRQGKRRHESSDILVVVPQPNHRHAETGIHRKSHPREDRPTDKCSNSSSISQSEAGTSSPVRIKTYEKRARHKTRSDRYDPKAKKVKKEGNSHRKQKRRGPLRNDDGIRTAALAQNFQLKDRPKNGRLTLKTDAKAGLFKHGRASLQMTGRGTGLPDLIFNEMKFLQKPAEHQDERHEAEEQELTMQSKRKQAANEEMSTYFKANQATTTTHAETTNISRDRKRSNERIENFQKGEKRSRRPPLVDLPHKPFLGFGSKGARHENQSRREESTEYFSWSDSARPQSPPAKRRDRQQGKNDLREKVNGMDNDARQTTYAQDSDTAGDRTKASFVNHQLENKARKSRITKSSLFAVDQEHRGHRQNTSITTLQSLPRRPSPGKEVDLNRRYPIYCTSEILDIRDLQEMSKLQRTERRHLQNDYESDKENMAPVSSIDDALRRVHNTVDEPMPVQSEDAYANQLIEDFNHTHQLDSLAAAKDTVSILSQGPPGAVNQRGQAPQDRCAIQDSVEFRQPDSRSYGHALNEEVNIYRSHRREAQATNARPPAYPDVHDMLDDGHELVETPFIDHDGYVRSPQLGGLVYTATMLSGPGLFETQALRPEDRHSQMSTTRAVSSLNSMPEYYVPQMNDEQLSGRPSTMDEQLVGFWKPQKLY